MMTWNNENSNHLFTIFIRARPSSDIIFEVKRLFIQIVDVEKRTCKVDSCEIFINPSYELKQVEAPLRSTFFNSYWGANDL